MQVCLYITEPYYHCKAKLKIHPLVVAEADRTKSPLALAAGKRLPGKQSADTADGSVYM